ncbi:class I SAM-dependent methyltransferase [Ramlibacter rhizophilus]|nr:class I SAM-dependent methyltransferase [Ramlibacter rhizophilus]
MADHWSSGYVADMTYSYGYYHELSPPFIRFFLLMNGLANASGSGPYTYCELGFGQGVSCNLHAAANPRGRFFGTDFNPEHAVFAQSLAAEARLEASWWARSFEDMLDAELPPLDFVVLHGVWSWIDNAARHAVVEFLRRHLKVGGAVFISYNVLPGWSAEKPLRDLLWMHTDLASGPAEPTAGKIREALQFAERLRQGKAAFFERNGPAAQMLDDMLRDDLHVVAHEYFNRSWHLTYFPELAQALDGAGLSFACSLHRSDLTGEVFHRAQSFQLSQLPLVLRQAAHDFILNRRFRRDVFVRGPDRLPRSARDEQLLRVGLVLLRPAASISAVQQTPYGSVTLDATITQRAVKALEAAGGPLRIGELIERADMHSSPRERVFETLAALVAQSQLAPVFDEDRAAAEGARAAAMNRAIAARAQHDDTLRYLCSPLTGQAVDASRLDRQLWLAWQDGARTRQALREAVVQGQAVDLPEGGLDAHIAQFLDVTAPQWQGLAILEA